MRAADPSDHAAFHRAEILAALLNGVFWVIDMPARRTVMGDIAGLARIGPAMTLESITNNGTRMVGPVVGGLLLQVLGLDGTFVLSAGLQASGVMQYLGDRLLRHGPSGEGQLMLLTAAIIAPVGRIAYRGEVLDINAMRAGELTRSLYDEITGLQTGERPDVHGWNRIIALDAAAAAE